MGQMDVGTTCGITLSCSNICVSDICDSNAFTCICTYRVILDMGRSPGQRGKRWERDAAKELTVGCGYWKRTPGSGAFGTQTGDASITGDLIGRYPWWRDFKAEAKYGYGTQKSLSLKREWVTKIREEASRSRQYPCLLVKFKGVTGGDIASSKLIMFDLETWNKMMTQLGELWAHYLTLLEMTSTPQ